jgi:hypothetical protein
MRTSWRRVVVVAAAFAVAGCAGTSATSGTGVNDQRTSASHTTDELRVLDPLTPDQVARELINAVAPPPGAVRSARSPSVALRHPPDRPTIAGMTVRTRWWRIDKRWGSAYAWVARHQAAFLHSDSSGSTAGPTLGDVEKNIDFVTRELPQSVNSATLTIAVAPLTAHTSAIAAYAVVVREPPRPVATTVPLTLDQVTVVARSALRNSRGHGPIVTRRTVTGSEARRLVRDFDQLKVRPPGVTSCPLAWQSETATFRSGGHTWVATTGLCVGVAVSLDGHAVAALDTTAAFDRDMREALNISPRDPIMTGPLPPQM